MDNPPQAESNRSLGRSLVLGALGLAVSGVVVAVILRRLDFAKTLAQLHELGWGVYLLMASIHLASHVLRGARFVCLSGGGRSLRLWSAIRVVLVGYALNNLAPLRLGEFAKAAGIGKFSGRTLPQGLSLVALERIYDGVALVLVLAGALAFVPETGGPMGRIHSATHIAGICFFTGACGLVLVVIFQARLLRWLSSFRPSWLVRTSLHVLEMVVLASRPAVLVRVAALTAGIWIMEMTVFWVALSALHLDPGVHPAALCMGLTCLGIALPSAPGGFGVYEASVALALVLLGKTDQDGYTVGFAVHAAQWVADTILGLCFLPGLGFAITQRRSETSNAQDRPGVGF